MFWKFFDKYGNIKIIHITIYIQSKIIHLGTIILDETIISCVIAGKLRRISMLSWNITIVILDVQPPSSHENCRGTVNVTCKYHSAMGLQFYSWEKGLKMQFMQKNSRLKTAITERLNPLVIIEDQLRVKFLCTRGLRGALDTSTLMPWGTGRLSDVYSRQEMSICCTKKIAAE